MKEQSNYKYIIQRNNTTATQHEDTDMKEKGLVEKYGHRSAPAITHILKRMKINKEPGKEKDLQTRNMATLQTL